MHIAARFFAVLAAVALLFPSQAAQAAARDGGLSYVVPRDDHGAIRILYPNSGHDYFLALGSTPAWSPDGRRLAFVGPGDHLRFLNADGSVTATGVPVPGLWEYSAATMEWSPDGSHLAYSDITDGISVVNTQPPYDPHQIVTNGYSPSWSPDGQRIVYASSDGDLHVVRLNGTGNTDITRTPKVDETRPDWSPDGKFIAYLASGTTPTFPTGVWIANADGSGAHFVTSTYYFCCGPPDWSPSGAQLAFTATGGIYAVRPDGTDLRLLVASPRRGDAVQPAWRPTR